MLDMQTRPRTSEMQKISGITKLEETRTGTKIESLLQVSGQGESNHSMARCSSTI